MDFSPASALTPRGPYLNVHLGDVVVGWPGDGRPACIYYDAGRWHTDGQFEVLGTINRPDEVLLNALGKLASDHDMDWITIHEHQERLLRSKHKRKFIFPSLDKGRLFQASYQHAGVYGDRCAGCDASQLVARPERTEEDVAGFLFHRGRIATGNAVIQDGERRDEIQDRCDGALCVEMEAAGVYASRPCLVIRGISDYADSHKGDAWRSYAAGNAAVFARELLSKIPPGKVLSIAAQGLGGIGKTQVAIEAAYRIHEAYPDCSVFWAPAVDMTMFENAYREIGRALGVKGIEEDKADVKALVKAALGRTDAGNWLLVFDNVDDVLLLTDGQLMQSLPFSWAGSILFTTSNHQAAVRFDTRDVIRLGELDESEARELLHQRLQERQIGHLEDMTKLLDYLTYLPLAIRQASAYLVSNTDVTILKYLNYCKSSNQGMIKMLSKAFDDQDRYQAIQNTVATTWVVSFAQVSRDVPLAACYLRSMAYFAEKDIPVSLLSAGEDEMERDEVISTLRAYAFILDRGTPGRFDVHRLVRLTMQNWLRSQGEQSRKVTDVVWHLLGEFPWPTHENRDRWAWYLPHARSVLELRGECTKKERLGSLEHNVAECYGLLGKYSEAEQMHRETLALRETVLGREHLSTLASMNNLEKVFSNIGMNSEVDGAN